MKAPWTRAFSAALQRTPSQTDAARLANVLIAAAVRERRVQRSAQAVIDAGAARAAIAELSLQELPAETSGSSFAKLVEHANEAAAAFDGQDFDGWVEAFQDSSPGRKSLGAFATPRVFADALAAATAAGLVRRDTPITVLDPSAGAGSLLLAMQRVLAAGGFVFELHGLEIDPAARELCCLLIWLSTPHATSLESVQARIRQGNAATYDWAAEPQFDVVIMNPPWESLRHPAAAHLEVERAATLDRLTRRESLDSSLPELFSCQGTGDRNLAKVFLELAPHLLRSEGRVGALIPGAFASDLGMAELRGAYFRNIDIERWTSFENREKHFPIDGRYKFGVLTGTKRQSGSRAVPVRFLCSSPQEVFAPHISLPIEEVENISGSSWMLPELVSERERALLVRILRSGLPFFEGFGGLVRYRREFDLTVDRRRGHFVHIDAKRPLKSLPGGLYEDNSGTVWAPLVEGRMVGGYDCYKKSWQSGAGRRAVWIDSTELALGKCQPQFLIPARAHSEWRVALCDVTSATNTRTVYAALVPRVWSCGNTAPTLGFDRLADALAAVAVMNSMVFDWQARRMIAGLHLNKFYLKLLRWPQIDEGRRHRLAAMAAEILRRRPHSCAVFKEDLSDFSLDQLGIDPCLSYNAICSLIEVEVADGYKLDPEALRFIYGPDKSDRRGFWRYFRKDPLAQEVAQAAISGLVALGTERQLGSELTQPAA